MELNPTWNITFVITKWDEEHNEYFLILQFQIYIYEPFCEKTNIVDFALSIDPDQPKHTAQANPDGHC